MSEQRSGPAATEDPRVPAEDAPPRSTRATTDSPRPDGLSGAQHVSAAPEGVPPHDGDLPESDPLLDTAIRHAEAGVDDSNPFGTLGRPLRRSPFLLGFTFALGAILAYVLYQALISVWSVLVLIIVSAFLAIGLHPTVTRLERLGMRRGLAVTIVLLGLLGFLVGFGYAIVPPIAHQAQSFATALPGYVDNLQQNPTLRGLNSRFGLLDRARSALDAKNATSTGTKALGGIFGVGKIVFATIFNVLTVLILTLYFVGAFERIKNLCYRMVPRPRRARAVLLGDEILNRVGGYVAGAFVIAMIAGLSSLIWLSLPFIRVPYALALAMLVAILDVIPLVGATIGAVVVTLVAFTVSLPVGLATLVFYIAYQQIENYLIYPRVMKRSVDVHPAAAIVAVLIGGALLGVLGALLAIPVAAAIALVMEEIVLPRQDGA
jgi:predicted PurR-regulated permease PerM